MQRHNLISFRKTIRSCINVSLFLSLLFVYSVCAAQTRATNPTASVSGRVTIGGKGAEGITVVASVKESAWQNRAIAKTVTDSEGNYHLTKLGAGQFTITLNAKSFVVGGSGYYKEPEQSVNVAEDESITKIDFALLRGGVITGRVTDLDGRPIISERVNVVSENGSGSGSSLGIFPQSKNQTDDRGIFRIYGLGPGNYKVSVGRAATTNGETNTAGLGSSQYMMTFYPGVAEASKATAIEVSEGSETIGVDITAGKFARGFSVSGRVIDAISNLPVANAYIAYSTVNEETQRLGQTDYTASETDTNGKFHLEGIEPGHYAAFTMAMGMENSYSEPATFYVSSGDVTGIEIKIRRGGIIEGVAVIENGGDLAPSALLQSVFLYAYVNGENGTSVPSFSQTKIGPDGSFRFQGLAPGNVRIGVTGFPAPQKGLELVRTELQGQNHTGGIEVAAGARVSDVRLVFNYGTGKIRGELKIEGGEWREDTSIMLSIRAVAGSSNQYSRSIEVDTRGRFLAEYIPPGSYELVLRSGASPEEFEPIQRTITVANDVEVPITIDIDLLVPAP